MRRGVSSRDIDVAMREAFGPDTQKLHIHHDSAVDDGDAEAAGRFSKLLLSRALTGQFPA